jgi:hypothetical protein
MKLWHSWQVVELEEAVANLQISLHSQSSKLGAQLQQERRRVKELTEAAAQAVPSATSSDNDVQGDNVRLWASQASHC